MTGLSAALIASNAAKQRLTHCPKGHPYAGPNLYVNPYHKGRVCRTCHNLNQRERRRQKAGRQGAMARPLHTPTNDELMADLLAVYHDLGYLTSSAYDTYGTHNSKTVANRFGSWSKALKTANIPISKKKRAIEMMTVRCLGFGCDEWFERRKDDPSQRRCKHCTHAVRFNKPFNEEFLYVG